MRVVMEIDNWKLYMNYEIILKLNKRERGENNSKKLAEKKLVQIRMAGCCFLKPYLPSAISTW